MRARNTGAVVFRRLFRQVIGLILLPGRHVFRRLLNTYIVFCSPLMNWRWPETLLTVLAISLESANWSYNTPTLVQGASWTTLRKLDTRCVPLLVRLFP